MPSSSVMLMPVELWEKSWPPIETSEPSGSAASRVRPASCSASDVDGSTDVVPTDSWIGTSAAAPSELRFAVDGPSYGELAAVTWGICSMAVMASSTAASKSASVTSPPSGATAMSWADVPLTCGNVRARASSASWDSVPGML